MQIADEQCLAHAGGHAHSGDREPRAEGEAYVPREIDVGQGIGEEGIIVGDERLNGLGLDILYILTGYALCDRVEKLIRRNGEQIFAHGGLQGIALYAYRDEIVYERAADGVVLYDLRKLLLDIDDVHAVTAEYPGENVVLAARHLNVGGILRKHSLEEIGHKARKLHAGAVKHNAL